MEQDLHIIDTWLKENAQGIYHHALNPPAKTHQFDELERLSGATLPDDFRQLYQWHDGINDTKHLSSLFYGYDFWDLDKVIRRYQSNLEDKEFRENIVSFIEDNSDKEINPQGFIDHLKWIQFAHDWSRTGFYLDLNPSEYGHYGQVIFMDLDYDVAFVVVASIGDFIKQIRQDMQDGYYSLSQELLAEKGYHWLVVDARIDILNWHNSERWHRE